MKQLQQAIHHVFLKLTASLEQLSSEQYSQPCGSLFGHTVGQHVRHIIELFQSLEKGYKDDIVNYDRRKRDVNIEKDKVLAIRLLLEISAGLDKANKDLQLEAIYDDQTGKVFCMATNYFREIAYNLEHTIHHMAMIRIGINEVSTIFLSEDFGVASSTLKHRNQCVR